MKHFNNQILEAINKGLKLALDDYQDIEDNNSIYQSNDIIDTEDEYKKYFILQNFVDLGLPSGTLWAKYNLGVSLKSKNPNKSLIGGYFAWGELKPKKEFTIKRYKFGDDVIEAGSTKYNREDELSQLLQEDDVVTQIYKDPRYHMPTLEQAQELIENTKVFCIRKNNPFQYDYMPNYKIDGDYNEGWLLMSKINGECIFFPHTGIYDGRLMRKDTPSSGVWTSTVCDHKSLMADSFNTCAQALSFNTGGSYRTRIIYMFGMYKYQGLQIRPVFNENN